MSAISLGNSSVMHPASKRSSEESKPKAKRARQLPESLHTLSEVKTLFAPYAMTPRQLLRCLGIRWQLEQLDLQKKDDLGERILKIASKMHVSFTQCISQIKSRGCDTEAQNFFDNQIIPHHTYLEETLAKCNALQIKRNKALQTGNYERVILPNAIDDLIRWTALTSLDAYLSDEVPSFPSAELQGELISVSPAVNACAKQVLEEWTTSWRNALDPTRCPLKEITHQTFIQKCQDLFQYPEWQKKLSALFSQNQRLFLPRYVISQAMQDDDFPCSIEITETRKVLFHFTTGLYMSVLGEGAYKSARRVISADGECFASIGFILDESHTAPCTRTLCSDTTCVELRNIKKLQALPDKSPHICLPLSLPIVYRKHPGAFVPFTARLLYPLYSGGNLFDALRTNTFDLCTRVKMAVHIAEAVDYLHRAGMIHRDLKANNILLNDKNEPFLTDFGASHFLEVDPPKRLRTLQTTVPYMSPEGLKAHEDLKIDVPNLSPEDLKALKKQKKDDFAATNNKSLDYWSLGCVFYEVLIDTRLPWGYSTNVSVINKYHQDHLKQGYLGYKPPSRLNCEASLANPTMSLLRITPPEKRPTAAETAQTLRQSYPSFFS